MKQSPRHAIRSLVGVIAIACPLLTGVARAESAFGDSHGTVERIDAPSGKTRDSDGVYGRFNGDLSLSLSLGLEAGLSESAYRPLAIGSLSVYQTAGLYASYREATSADDSLERAASLGLDISPLFLLRWSNAWERGPAFWDLTLDSLTLSGGAAFLQPDTRAFADEVAGEFALGLGVPLMGKANGLWLRSRAALLASDELAGTAWLSLSWQGFTHAGLLKVDP